MLITGVTTCLGSLSSSGERNPSLQGWGGDGSPALRGPSLPEDQTGRKPSSYVSCWWSGSCACGASCTGPWRGRNLPSSGNRVKLWSRCESEVGVGRHKCIGHHSLWQKQSKNLPGFLAFLDPNSQKPKSIGKLQGKKKTKKTSCFVRATRLLIYQLNRKGRSKQVPSLLWKL